MIHQETWGLWWLNTQFKEKRGIRTRLLIPPSSPTAIPKRPQTPINRQFIQPRPHAGIGWALADLGLLTPFNS